MIQRHIRLAALAILPLYSLCPAQEGQAQKTKPNIVYILADDLGYGEVGSYGQKKIKTPHLDRLATEGMSFTRHYCGAPVCAPSRCVLLTGKHLGHARIRNNRSASPVEGQWPISRDDRTIGSQLQEAGYKTAAIGKWGLGPSRSSGDPNDHGFDLFYGFICQRVAHSYYPPHVWHNRERITINTSPVPGRHRPKDGATIDFASYIGETYAPDKMNEAVEAFVRENQKRPFFLYFAPIEPHVAMHPPQEWVDSYPKSWDKKAYRGNRGYLPHPAPRAGYAAMISDLDQHVGQLLELLDELGLRDNTLVIFSSDNGPTHDVGGADTKFFDSAGGLRGRKGSVYEGGIRVPMIARWPGKIKAGSSTDHPSAFYDVMPTLCDVAGAKPPTKSDGISFLPTLTQTGEQEPHDFLLWEFHGYGGQQALISGDWKLIRKNLMPRRRGKKQKKAAPAKIVVELYNLKTDPREAHNVAAQHPERVKQAIAILQREHSINSDFPIPSLDKPQSSKPKR